MKAAGLFSDIRVGWAFSETDATIAKVDIKVAKAIGDIELAALWSDICLSLLTCDFDFSTAKTDHHIIYKKTQLNKFQLGLALFLG